MPKPSGPTKKPSKRTTAAARKSRSSRLAAGAVGGQSIAALARHEDLSRATVARELQTPATRILIASLLDKHKDVVDELLETALHVIRASFTASLMTAQKLTTVDLLSKVRRDETVIVEVGPDHYARLAGAKRLIELVTAGRSAPKEESSAQGIATLEEIQSLLDQQQVQ